MRLIWSAVIISAFSAMGYMQLYHDVKGVLAGAGIGVGVIFLQALLTNVHLVTLVLGGIGAILGLLAARVKGMQVVGAETLAEAFEAVFGSRPVVMREPVAEESI